MVFCDLTWHRVWVMEEQMTSQRGDADCLSTQSTLVGIELVHMLRKGQLEDGGEQGPPWPNSSLLWPHNPPLSRDRLTLERRPT